MKPNNNYDESITLNSKSFHNSQRGQYRINAYPPLSYALRRPGLDLTLISDVGLHASARHNDSDLTRSVAVRLNTPLASSQQFLRHLFLHAWLLKKLIACYHKRGPDYLYHVLSVGWTSLP
ncbi:hypothetical protein BaRGS_00023204 [Batillaria attramentaria]|uniref:Uncharacterized protein n=1 Tax=Batillaria attramentaria TaxID=370345 RepID=A0ABD0KED5_9CAEN